MEVANNKRLTIKFVLMDGTEEILRGVMCYAYDYSKNKMEVGFSDGYVETYIMKNVSKITIE